jgi:hypothetical protein
MSNVIAVRVPKELKKELEELDIDYASDIREYLEKKVKQKLLAKTLVKISQSRKRLEKKIGKTSSSVDFIRADREHGH